MLQDSLLPSCPPAPSFSSSSSLLPIESCAIRLPSDRLLECEQRKVSADDRARDEVDVPVETVTTGVVGVGRLVEAAGRGNERGEGNEGSELKERTRKEENESVQLVGTDGRRLEGIGRTLGRQRRLFRPSGSRRSNSRKGRESSPSSLYQQRRAPNRSTDAAISPSDCQGERVEEEEKRKGELTFVQACLESSGTPYFSAFLAYHAS